ncbi:MAG: hypothetical protein M3P93_11685 [Actinomycetota bacterium]|nr:hypothetical protein [Actinomycetota bacterium]
MADARTADRVPALVSVEWLRDRLEDPQVLPVEVSNDAWTYYRRLRLLAAALLPARPGQPAQRRPGGLGRRARAGDARRPAARTPGVPQPRAGAGRPPAPRRGPRPLRRPAGGTSPAGLSRADVFAGLPGQTEADLPVPGHRLPGHIPGAVNLPAAAVLHPVTGRFRAHEELRRLFAAAGVRQAAKSPSTARPAPVALCPGSR